MGNTGGIKCLTATCASAGPAGSPGFFTNADMWALVKSVPVLDAAKAICEWRGIAVPELEPKTNGKSVGGPPPGRFPDDEPEPTDPRAPPDAKQQKTQNDCTASVAAGIVWHDARSIFAPLPPTNWLVPELQICPGRPTLWCGYGYVGKSITAQSKAVAMAGGMPVFGKFDIRRGVVRHFDHEQGKHATFKRYQRIAVGMDLEPGELDGRLFVTVFPSVYLNMPNAVDVYARLCEGTDFAIIDALRGATPGEDENDSKIRICLDNLGRVSEKVGTIFEVLHHSGKPKDEHADQRTKARGSSAIFDACGPVFILSGSKESPHKLVSQQKAPAEAEGSAVDDFFLTIDDVSHGFNPRAGVRVTFRTVDEIRGKPSEEEGAKSAAHDEKVLAVIKANPAVNVTQLRALARPLRNPDIDDAIARLVMSSKVEIKPGANRQVLHFEGGKS